MATPKQAAGTTEVCSSVETAVSSTSADESCSGHGMSLGEGVLYVYMDKITK